MTKAKQHERCRNISFCPLQRQHPAWSQAQTAAPGAPRSMLTKAVVSPHPNALCLAKPLSHSTAPLGRHRQRLSPVPNWGCAQPCPVQEPGAISAGQQGEGDAAPVTPWIENVFYTAKRHTNIPHSWGLGPGLSISCAQELPGKK